MGISKEQLSGHLENYFQVTGRKVDRFVCPITLRECEESELIDAHILNQAFVKASRRRIIQYGKIDHFYGSRFESGLVKFLNLGHESELDLLKEGGELRVTLSDGTTVPAFLADSESARNAAGKFPLVDLTKDGKHIATVFLKMQFAEPIHVGQVEVSASFLFAPYDWVGALLKAAHLTLFDLLGYNAVFDPYGDTVRRTLHHFYQDRSHRNNADRYFKDLRNAAKIIALPSPNKKPECAYDPFPFDTLDDREVLVHLMPGETLFALTCIFKINEATVSVMLPQSKPGTNPSRVLEWYEQCSENPLALPQNVHRCRFDGAKWNIEKTPQKIGVMPE